MRKPLVLKPRNRQWVNSSFGLAGRCIFVALTLCALSSFSLAFAPPAPGGRLTHRQTSVRASLDSLTVKELRELVKGSVKQRGVLSKLKKKQDLINFLESSSTAGLLNGYRSPRTQSIDEPERKTPLGMPPTDATVSHGLYSNDLNDDRLTSSSQGNKPPSQKATAFENVLRRYPPLKDAPVTNYTSPANDMRQIHHPMLSELNTTNADMELIFVGTASCTPGSTRGVSCTALRLNWRRRSAIWSPDKNRWESVDGFQGGTWIFDVGECTQLQIQQTPSVRPSKITKIFLTHAHGDHSFGLPGLLCLMGQHRDRDSPPVEIYGPEGLRMWLRVAIRYSVSRIVPPYRVHEIIGVPMAPEWDLSSRGRRYFFRGLKNKAWERKGLAGEDNESWITVANQIQLDSSKAYGEIDGGRNILPIFDHPLSSDGAPVWEVEDEDDVKVYAAPMSHSIPCVGYVVEEQPRPGRLRNELVEPIVLRNVAALRDAGFKVPMKAMAVIKNLAPGSSFTFPDGSVVTQEEAVEPPKQGRKVVICGDTCSSRSLVKLAEHADVVVHESTNCFLAGIDRDTNLRSVTHDAMVHGHSTPQIAGFFAKKVKARSLVLNHFSSRYKGDASVESLSIMMRIEKIAVAASGLDEAHVAAAWDLMVLPVPPNTSSQLWRES